MPIKYSKLTENKTFLGFFPLVLEHLVSFLFPEGKKRKEKEKTGGGW